MNLRKLLFWTHLTAGVTAGAVILLMSVTGVLLTYERQLIEWSDRGFRSSPPTPDSARLSPDQLLAGLKAQRADQRPTSITLQSDRTAPAAVAIGSGTLYLDAYTGRVLGAPTTDVRSAMTTLRSWHRYIGMSAERRALGKSITGWANFIFFFIVLSGLYLWLPRVWSRQQVRAVAFFRGGLRGKARDFNWHNTIGIWSAIPLALIVAGAMPISFPWANALVYRVAGEEVPAPGGSGNAGRGSANGGGRVGTVDSLWTRAEQQVPEWRSITLRLPASIKSPASFTIDSGTGGQPQRRATLTLDASTGVIVRWEPFQSQTLGRSMRSWLRFTHTGEYYGLVGQTIAGLASAGAVLLVWTGLSLAIRRLFGRVTRGNKAATAESNSEKVRAA